MASIISRTILVLSALTSLTARVTESISLLIYHSKTRGRKLDERDMMILAAVQPGAERLTS